GAAGAGPAAALCLLLRTADRGQPAAAAAVSTGADRSMSAAAPHERGHDPGWDGLLDGLPQPAWVVALATCRVVAANAAAAGFFARPPRSLIGARADGLA